MVFEKQYSNLYDSFYQDKNYAQECDLIEAVFNSYRILPHSILDLGCGTGSHDVILAKRGYEVTGVDRSPHMLETARKKAEAENVDISFIQHDINEVTPELLGDKKFDVVISMFAVMGYLTENKQLEQVFSNIRKLLKIGGIFLFDGWYGPAVLSQRPESRVHSYDVNENHHVLRLVTPELDSLHQVVNIHYRVLEIKEDQVLNDTSETHQMRYFFPMETRYFIEKAGFYNVGLYPFGDLERDLTLNDWNMLVAAR